MPRPNPEGIVFGERSLPEFGRGPWANFYYVARNAQQISIYRPFYPQAPGRTSQQHILDGIGIPSMSYLLRECERATSKRAAASHLFRTLGAKQVGRAAIAGWQDVLAPALRQSPSRLTIWPFTGELHDLLESSGIVVVETYPAEACVQLGLGAPGRGWSTRNQAHRRAHSAVLKHWAQNHAVDLAHPLVDLLDQGFGASSDAEDRFDAIVGLFGMLDVILTNDSYDAPRIPQV